MLLVLSGRRSWRGWLAVAGLGLAVVIGLVLVIGPGRLAGGLLSYSASVPEAETAPAPGHEAPVTTVTLSEPKWKTIQPKTEPVRLVALPNEIVVPGVIEVNVDRRVSIRPRVTGVIRSVPVLLGQKVRAGDLLVTLDSPDVGTARLDVRARQLDLSLAQTETKWRTMVSANVEELIRALSQNIPAETLEKQFVDKPLGTDRGSLMSAYADLEMARHEEQKQVELYQKHIVGEHPMSIAIHSREGAQAKFEAILEQLRHDAMMQQRQADQQVRRAEAALIDAEQRLRILGASTDPSRPLPDPTATPSTSSGFEDVTAYPIVAPFDGTITHRSAVPSQRAEPTDVLFTLADLSTVRAVANIPESQFAALPNLDRARVRVTATAYPGRTFEAHVIYVGAEVDPMTRTVRLLAEAANPDGVLRPGMFARVALDAPPSPLAPTIPASASVELEGREGVFVPLEDSRSFRFQPVELGREAAGRRLVLSGLKPGQPVVAQGAYLLKSELILQNSDEEE